MKSFFASTDKENAQQAGYLFLIVNILGFITQGIMGMESPPGELLVNFLWGLSLSGVIPVSYTHLTLPTKRIV